MQDPVTGKQTCLCGAILPAAREWADLLGDHRKRLRAFDQLVKKAGECGIRADKDRDFAILPEDEVSLLESAGGEWAEFGLALREFRRLLPFLEMGIFGFEEGGEDIFDANTSKLVRIGGGVEALAFQSADRSIYKFFVFIEPGDVGAAFAYHRAAEGAFVATAVRGSYALLFAKLLAIHQIGIPTEVVGITPEGVLVVKQTLGTALPQGTDTSKMLPAGLIEIPSRFLTANRDHPRLLFMDGIPWLVADLHARNFVRCSDGTLRVIDLVAAPWPADLTAREPLIADWLARVKIDPTANALPGARDDEL
jgi:hypothetical protein